MCAVLIGALAFPAHGGAVMAAVRDALFPTHPAKVLILPVSGTAGRYDTLHPVASLGDAQERVSFPILVPQTTDSWHLETILVRESEGNHAVELLYRIPARVAWVKIAERAVGAPLSALDADPGDMLAGRQTQRVSGNVTLTRTDPIEHHSLIRIIGVVRVTVSQTLAAGTSLLDVPLRAYQAPRALSIAPNDKSKL